MSWSHTANGISRNDWRSPTYQSSLQVSPPSSDPRKSSFLASQTSRTRTVVEQRRALVRHARRSQLLTLTSRVASGRVTLRFPSAKFHRGAFRIFAKLDISHFAFCDTGHFALRTRETGHSDTLRVGHYSFYPGTLRHETQDTL
jgi:hypothetical protein